MGTRRALHGYAIAAACTIGVGAWVAGCASDEVPAPAVACDGGDQAFIRRALLALNGRPARSQAEVKAWTEVLGTIQAREGSSAAARKVVARAMMFEADTFRERWSSYLMDALQVTRSLFVRESQWDKVQAKACYGTSLKDALDGGALAEWVRDHSPLETTPPYPNFDLGRLLSSSIALDDPTPIYRAQLFHMLQYPLAGANVDVNSLEAARRADLGTIFEETFINRDPTCLACHNSQTSVTDSTLPELDRSWPVAGLFEAALYGDSKGTEDPARYNAVFRVMEVRAQTEGKAPWGWDRGQCGGYDVPQVEDPLNVDAHFTSLSGKRVSIWDLEASLARGLQALRKTGLVRAADGSVEPDMAFAYLVAMNISERIWDEVMGSRLTIANYFPRNAAQRDVLQSLTNSFIASNFSLKSLLAEIVAHPTFNLAAPEDACNDKPYGLPALFNPWSREDADPARRGNGAGNRVHHSQTRVVRRAINYAMGWPKPSIFPDDLLDEEYQGSIGLFISPSKPGFRGLEFQAKLSWELGYGSCALHGGDDFITQLVVRARSTKGVLLRDAVLTLKDRLLGEPFIDELEAGPLAALLGAPLDTPLESGNVPDLETGLRYVCGACAGSPQFLLAGLAPHSGSAIPKLTRTEDGYAASCENIRAIFEEAAVPYVVSCLGDSATVSTR